MKKTLIFFVTVLLLMNNVVNAKELVKDNVEDTMLKETILEETAKKIKKNNDDVKKTFEIQLEYLNTNTEKNRDIKNYNVHVFQQFKHIKSLELYRGLTVTRATGYSRSRNKGWLDSEGVGVGPSFMLRYKRPISGKLHFAGDFTGSLMFYNKAHPAEGRAYGFLWRIGPRLLWQATKRDAVSLGYSVSHFSNGLRSHNPGYNGMGFTLNFQHKF